MDRDRHRDGSTSTPDTLRMPGAYVSGEVPPSPSSSSSSLNRQPMPSLDVTSSDNDDEFITRERACGLSISLSTGTNDSTSTRLRTPTTPILTLTSDTGYSDSPDTFLPQQSVAGWLNSHKTLNAVLPESYHPDAGPSSLSANSTASAVPKRRPSPLNLKKKELVEAETAPLTGMSTGSGMSWLFHDKLRPTA